MWAGVLAIAGTICFATFYAKGGLNLESMTSTELALTLGAAFVSALALAYGRATGPLHGAWPFALLLSLTVLSAVSLVWSVQPDSSWHDAGRMLAYTGVFGAAIVLARVLPGGWPALLCGVVVAAVVVCGYALLTKVFPAQLAPSNGYARLEEPFGYWNATGLMAAMGAVGCLWLAARRRGHALASTLAYPAMGLLLLTLVLAYSRGALAAFLIGLIAWFCLVPLRLRGAAVLLVGALGAGGVAAWDFSTHALSSEHVALAQRSSAGHRLGALVVAMLLVLWLAGVAIMFASARRPPAASLRRRAGAALIALIVLALVAFAAALAHSHRGFTGSISHAADSLTNPNAKPPPNTPGRLTAVASVRARYWKEAFQVFEAHPALGAGAEGYAVAHLRYRHETLSVRHAHGFLVQTLADLGLVGALLALALLGTWLAAAGRATHPFNRRWSSWSSWRDPRARRAGWRTLQSRELRLYGPERVALLTMLCVVLVFGVHSLVDWTWYVPGDACLALLCAGWLAGRGPLTRRAAPLARAGGELDGGLRAWLPPRLDGNRAVVIALIAAAALLAAWTQWQPQRSEEARQDALALLASDRRAAGDAARTAVSRDPLSAEALFTLAGVQNAQGDAAAARNTLARAVRLQPSNPKTWLELGRFDLARSPASALQELRAAIYLDPETIAPEAIQPPNGQREAIEIYNDYIQALRAAARQGALSSASARRASGAGGARRAGRPPRARRPARSRSAPSGH